MGSLLVDFFSFALFTVLASQSANQEERIEVLEKLSSNLIATTIEWTLLCLLLNGHADGQFHGTTKRQE
jgi:hypothetical protein